MARRSQLGVTILAALTSISLLATTTPLSAKGYKWNCSYSQRASVEGLVTDTFKLEFADDDATQEAVMIGNNGFADVEFQSARLGVSFLEKLSTGVVQTTTIAQDGTSVHSRHTIMGTKLIASQYYGRCAPQ